MSVRAAEVVVIGGGIAGLSAAWALRDRDVVVLEASEKIGGRIETIVNGEYWINFGAHLLGSADGPLAKLAHELDVPLATPPGTASAISIGNRIVRAPFRGLLPLMLPLPSAARVSLVRTGARLARAWRKARRADPTDMVGGLPALDHWPADPELDAISYADVLGPMHPQVAALFRVTANRLATEPDRLSGHIGVTVAMSRWNKPKPIVIGGTSRLTRAIGERLEGRVLTHRRVQRVMQDTDRVLIALDGDAEPSLSAHQCIVAVPAPEARRVVTNLPPAKDAALGAISYGPFVVAGIFTRETGRMPWDDLYGLAVIDRSFCMLFNPANVLRNENRQPGGCLVVYAAGDRATTLLALTDGEIARQFTSDLEDLFPAARGIISDMHLRRWPLGVPIALPHRAKLQPQLARSVGRIHFCGDYMAHPGTDSAAWTAQEAARTVRQRLAEVS